MKKSTKIRNLKASRAKIKWNYSVESLRLIDQSLKEFKSGIKVIMSKNLPREEYRKEFVECVNKYLTKASRSGQVTEFDGCKYIFGYIKHERKIYSNQCKEFKSEFNESTKMYNKHYK